MSKRYNHYHVKIDFDKKRPECNIGNLYSEYMSGKTNKDSFHFLIRKCYLDDKRLVNIPNCDFNPTGIMLSYHNVSGNNFGIIKKKSC